MNTKWSDEDVRVCSFEELPLGRQHPHDSYHNISLGTSFNIVLLQEVFSGKSSRFHFHPVTEILVVLEGILIVETDKGKKEVPPRSVLYIPSNVIHRVGNRKTSSSTLSLLLIEHGYRDKDVVYVEWRDGQWQRVR